MKNLINKVKNFVKKNYIACTVIVAILLVIIASVIIINLIQMNRNKIDVSSKTESLYQYFDKSKKKFEAKLSYENDKLVNIKSNDYLVYENSPIYLEDSIGIIIPKQSSIVFYYRQNLSYRLPKYSTLTLSSSSTHINSNGNKTVETDFFIYDGLDTYVLPVASQLKVNGTEISLSSYSYVIANSNYVTYYDYEKDIVQTIENINSASLIINDLTIDLIKDVTVINSKVSLLDTQISKMDIYLED